MDYKVGNKIGEGLPVDLSISSDEFAARALALLESDSNESYARFQNLAKSVFLIPHAYISMAPRGSDTLRVRMDGKVAEVPKEGSFCGCVLDRSEILVVQNAVEDERFRDNPLVRDKMQIRFYAGAPLQRGSDEPFGTLCVMDTIPRALDEGRLTILRDLSSQIVEHLEVEVRNTLLLERLADATIGEESQSQSKVRSRVVAERPRDLYLEISLEDKVDRIFDLFSTEANAKGVELVSNISKDLGFSFDRDMLWMILQTTIFNGVKYCIFGGSVTVDAWKSSRQLIVSVSDTGAGMPLEKVQRILGEEPAVSGLAVCRRLLELNKGQMDILTEKGMGTTITLTFPSP